MTWEYLMQKKGCEVFAKISDRTAQVIKSVLLYFFKKNKFIVQSENYKK